MLYAVLDTETDGLLDTVSLLHCLCYQILDSEQDFKCIEINTVFDKESLIQLVDKVDYVVCHNLMRYDIPVFKKLFDYEFPLEKAIDSLALSYYLFPNFEKHGLEEWGVRVEVPKPKVEDWKNLTLEEYVHRCTEDVKINATIAIGMLAYLNDLYDNNQEDISNLIQYLNFKMDCLREHEEVKIKLDVELATKHRDDLLPQFENSTKQLSEIMPIENAKVLKTKPKKMFKQDGSMSALGMEWLDYLKDNNLPGDTEIHREDPNPGSDPQLKKWLFSLGWQPITFKVSKNTGEKIPQVNLPFGGGLCPSIKDLYEVESRLEILSMYYKIRHRIGVFNSFLENVDGDGYVKMRAHGFTNTLRLTHSKPIANMPKPGVFYGAECREVLTVPNTDEYIMLGADVSALEDSTKQHYIYFYDSEYVREMRVPGFDAHLDIGELAGLITKEESELYKRIDALDSKEGVDEETLKVFGSVKKKRGTAKSTNFSATYGAGGPKIAETAKVPVEEGFRFHKIYWKRNWAVKQIAEDAIVKTIRGQKWIFNPLSGFWLFLKAEKDRFSTLNQNTGNFVFDCWMFQVRKRLKELGIQVCLQYHDEMLIWCRKEHKEQVKTILRESMKKVNENLRLNVEVEISIDEGYTYSECH